MNPASLKGRPAECLPAGGAADSDSETLPARQITPAGTGRASGNAIWALPKGGSRGLTRAADIERHMNLTVPARTVIPTHLPYFNCTYFVIGK